MAGGGQAQSEQLLLLQAQIKAAFQPWQQDTDTDLPVQVFQLNAHGAVLSLPWGGDPLRWCLHADGSALHMDMRSGKAGQGKDLRLHTLPVLWLGHLTANAAGTVTTSVLSGADGAICMQPLPQQEAMALLQDLMLLYRQAWASPLPLPLKTACAYVMELQRAAAGAQARFAQQRALGEARKAFQGMRNSPGEYQTSPYVQRAFTGFDDMDMATFTALAERVYAPMLRVCAKDLTQQEEAEA
jgi:exonuclease V gamma subunit